MAIPTLDIVRWMLTQGRSVRDPARLHDALCNQLVLGGVPLARAALAMQTGPAETSGRGITWRPDKELLDITFPWEEITRDRFQHSPFRHIMFGGAPMRRRLLDPDCKLDFPILEELRDEGITDYIALPARLLDGRVHATTWATTDDFGFDMDDVNTIEAVNDVLPVLLELWELKANR